MPCIGTKPLVFPRRRDWWHSRPGADRIRYFSTSTLELGSARGFAIEDLLPSLSTRSPFTLQNSF